MREDNVRKIWSDAELDAALSDLHDDVDEDDGLAFARASLMAAAGTTEAPPRSRRRGTWRWIAVAAAVVTLAGGLGIVTSLREPAPEPSQPAAQPVDLDRPLEPGEFHYTRRLGWVPQLIFGLSAKAQQVEELWIPADPSGVWHRRTTWTGAVSGLDPTSQEKFRIDRTPRDQYGPAGIFSNRVPAGWLAPDASFVTSLPADRGQLGKALLRDGHGDASDTLTMVRNVLELGTLRKDVRIALRDALVALPSLHTEPGHTSDGRPAMVVIGKGTAQRLYLDPATARLLEAANGNTATTITRSNDVPLTTSQGPPSSVEVPNTTTTTVTTIPFFPPDSQKFGEPDAVYSYAITRTSG